MHNEPITLIKTEEPGAGRILTTTVKAYDAMYKQQGYEVFDGEAEDGAPFLEVSPPIKVRPLSGAAKAAQERKAQK